MESTIVAKGKLEVRGGSLKVTRGKGNKTELDIGPETSVVGRNEDLAKKPELLNSDPYGAGWLMRVAIEGAQPPFLKPAEYAQFLKESE